MRGGGGVRMMSGEGNGVGLVRGECEECMR